MVENQEKKKIWKGGRIFIWIFALIVLWIAIDSWKNATVQQNQTTSVQVDPLQERIERINEVFSEDQNFEKVEKLREKAFPELMRDTELIFIWAGLGVAVANAVDSLKAAADYVVAHVDDEGLSQAMRMLKLI